MSCSKNIKRIVIIGGAVALAAYLYKRARYHRQEVVGNYSPLVDRINVATDGVFDEQISFSWDDEERCQSARSFKVGEDAKVIEQKILEFEHYEDRILVAETNEELGDASVFSIFTLNELGMVSSITNRFIGGKEQRVDLLRDGSELQKVYSDTHEALLSWEEGNLVSISSDGEVRQKMSYYHHIENHLFPDLNLLIQGLCPEMATTYLMGTRSRNFLRSIITYTPSSQEKTMISYMLDHYDRPIQVSMETIVTKDGVTTNSSKEFDITYKRL